MSRTLFMPLYALWWFFMTSAVSFLHHWRTRLWLPLVLTTVTLTPSPLPVLAQEAEDQDPPDVAIGERLFVETRFAQLFKVFLENGGDVNDPLPSGDPALERLENSQLDPEQYAPGPFAGESMNCRNCHMVDEKLDTP